MSSPWSLVVVSDGNYVLPTAVCLRSVDTHIEDPPTAVYVLAEDIPADGAELIERQFRSAPVRFVKVTSPLASFAVHEEAAHLTPAMFLKCVAPRLLDEAADVLVYLDSDTLVLGDLAQLAHTDIGDNTAGCVEDRYVTSNVLDPGARPYYNSGVILADRERWNAAGTTENIISLITQNADVLNYPDQDAINKVLRGAIFPLDRRWNHMVGETVKTDPAAPVSSRVEEATVLHYCGPIKPWRTKLSHPYLRDVYDKYLTLTLT
jgi:lipopolysaccharide biosynthesis glycosyltransferase